jgi:WhiB family transcriptional regulator, redox-sensing transcriptional regulator
MARWVRILNGNQPKRLANLPEGRGPHTRVRGPICFQARSPTDQQNWNKREGMAPMQWPDASTEAVTVIEPYTDKDMAASGIAALFSFAGTPAGLDLPCTDDPELFFAEAPADVEAAKALCQGCRIREACLEGALERREPWGVWGGELLLRGTVVPRKRPRGRPRKDAAECAA